MKTLVLANQKGGVGKSAVGVQLAYYLAHVGKRVLFLDLDHQRNSSTPIVKSKRAVAAGFTATELLLGKPGVLPAGDFVLVPGDDQLSSLERQPDKHNVMVNSLKGLLDSVQSRFDICIVDTNPNPDIRYAAAMATSDFVLSPIQLNQEAIDGIGSLLTHPRYGFQKIKAVLNRNLELIGILPNMVEPTPFQKGNFSQLVAAYSRLLIPVDVDRGRFAFIPKRSVIAEAQAEGLFIAEIRKTAAKDAWREIKPSFDVIAQRMSIEV